MNLLKWIKQMIGLESMVKPSGASQFAANVKRGLVAEMLRVVRELDAADIRETEGKNQGPGIRQFWGATSYGFKGYDDRQPWCAAAACWIVREACFRIFGVNLAALPFRLPRSAAVLGWIDWAKSNSPHWQYLNPLKTKVRAGDIIGWDFNGPMPSGTHIGIAVTDEDGNGRFSSGEGNTDATGTREGDEFLIHPNRTRKGAIYIIRYAA